MQLPFTTEQFVSVFAAYNHAIGILPLLAYAAALIAVIGAICKASWTGRYTALALAGMWAFTGVAYHLVHFSAINPAARIFGIAFVLQAILFGIEAFRDRLTFRFDVRDWRARMGAIMVTFSALIYPLIGMLAGHGYPNGPVFGLTPCPLVIFTFGMLMMSDRTLPKYLLVIPMLWAVVGFGAARSLGIREDTGLFVSGLLATTALTLRNTRAAATMAHRHGHAFDAVKAAVR